MHKSEAPTKNKKLPLKRTRVANPYSNQTDEKLTRKYNKAIKEKCEIFFCKECKWATLYVRQYKRHLTLNHNGTENMFSCTKCAYIAPREEYVNVHMKVAHHVTKKRGKKTRISDKNNTKSELPVLKNERCNNDINAEAVKIEMNDKQALRKKRSKKLHPSKACTRKKRYRCNECKFSSISAAALEEHCKALHSKQKDFFCKLCAFTTGWRNSLYKHISNVHKESTKEYFKKYPFVPKKSESPILYEERMICNKRNDSDFSTQSISEDHGKTPQDVKVISLGSNSKIDCETANREYTLACDLIRKSQVGETCYNKREEESTSCPETTYENEDMLSSVQDCVISDVANYYNPIVSNTECKENVSLVDTASNDESHNTSKYFLLLEEQTNKTDQLASQLIQEKNSSQELSELPKQNKDKLEEEKNKCAEIEERHRQEADRVSDMLKQNERQFQEVKENCVEIEKKYQIEKGRNSDLIVLLEETGKLLRAEKENVTQLTDSLITEKENSAHLTELLMTEKQNSAQLTESWMREKEKSAQLTESLMREKETSGHLTKSLMREKENSARLPGLLIAEKENSARFRESLIAEERKIGQLSVLVKEKDAQLEHMKNVIERVKGHVDSF